MIDDVRAYNRAAWDAAVERQNEWTVPVTPAQVAAARAGDWQVVLTPTRPEKDDSNIAAAMAQSQGKAAPSQSLTERLAALRARS